MATDADIQKVQDHIEDDAAAHGWSIEIIQARLDAGQIPERVIAVYWRKRATATMQLVNTSEAGSSRGNDTIYPRMLAEAQKWEAAADLIENPPVVSTADRARNGTIVRK